MSFLELPGHAWVLE